MRSWLPATDLGPILGVMQHEMQSYYNASVGPISNIGPKTSWAARDRPDLNQEVKFSRRNNLSERHAGRQPHGGGGRQQIACGSSRTHTASSAASAVRLRATLARGWRHLVSRRMHGLAAPTGAPPAASLRPSGRTGCAPPRNDCARPLAMAGHHARPARMVSRVLLLVRWAAARGGGWLVVFQDSQLGVALIQLVVPQAVDRVSQLAYRILCTSAVSRGMPCALVSVQP
ncbi:hypothetical protein F511_11300 [Dorcoceras hygrometricum]|uniref:Uncharacterized protein n=1 Tax=Dorcoceras hygrometricum TaxID=472368 RepID=A0A2Z7CP02_9LAMI|nr:hypothetical protein F511_11300 [Dorcoceras hygrometricum]